ncbi:hypothetical protein [Streptomyces anandii]|uniref:hypothetical protein n=1 Tax=Streptomyces anandii TaxID=285454 RepID=UPI0037A8F97C
MRAGHRLVPPGMALRCPAHTPPSFFRALVCNAVPDRGSSCGRVWVAHSPRSLTAQQRLRAAHHRLCAGGFFRAAGL